MTENPLLKKLRLPGETYRLPSLGLFYENGELADFIENGELEMRAMTAFDEIIINSPDKLLSGKGVMEVIASCIPNVLKPEELLAEDVDFILSVLRKLSFGDELSVEYTHDCKNAKKHSYSLNVANYISSTKYIDPTTVKSKYKFKYDNYDIAIRPIKFKDMIKLHVLQLDIAKYRYQIENGIYERNSDDNLLQLMKDNLKTSILATIKSVDGIEDRAVIEEWLNVVPRLFIDKLFEKIKDIGSWGVDFATKSKCKDCGEEITLTPPLNPLGFFF